MALTYLAAAAVRPVRAAAGRAARASLTWLLMALAFQPTLRFYRRSPLWGLALPAIGALYTGFTLQSAVDIWRGRGGVWKGRAQARLHARPSPPRSPVVSDGRRGARRRPAQRQGREGRELPRRLVPAQAASTGRRSWPSTASPARPTTSPTTPPCPRTRSWRTSAPCARRLAGDSDADADGRWRCARSATSAA